MNSTAKSYAVPLALITLATAVGVTYGLKKKNSLDAAKTCSTDGIKNSAFVFVKPHANTPSTQNLVRTKLTDSGITIISESDISGETIDEKKLIDQHYYAIASKATILSADKIPVPEDKFKAEFGKDWQQVLKDGKAVNAMEACDRFGIDATQLDA